MFKSNTTNAPDTKQYFLGKGKLYLSKLDPITNKPVAWRAVGNAKQFKVTVKTTKVQHVNSMDALAHADDEVATQQDVSLAFTADELSAENLALFFSGDVQANFLNPAIAGFTNVALIAHADAIVGTNSWFDIIDTSITASGVRAYDVAAADITLSGATVPTALVSGTDYIVDTAMGRIQLTAAGVAKMVTDGGAVKIMVAAAAGASPVVRTRAETTSPSRLAIKHIPLNAKSPADRGEFQAHSVMLTANGDFSMIEATYTEMSFEGLCGKNADVDATSPYCTFAALTTPRS